MLKISTSWSSLFSFQCSDLFVFTAYYVPGNNILLLPCLMMYYYFVFAVFLVFLHMAIDVSVHYNGGLLPDIILLTPMLLP